MKKETLAATLNGREYGQEISPDEEKQAKSNGLVIVFGYSDDNVEFRGAINEELGCGENTVIQLHSKGILDYPKHECDCNFCNYKPIANQCAEIKTLWCKIPDYSWTYETSIPHAVFDILEDGGTYCRGIVFSISDLPQIL
jgi:hypothetical protein